MKIRVGLFQGKNVVNVFPPGSEAFAVCEFLEIAEVLEAWGVNAMFADFEFFYVDE